ncbi:MAG: PilZ domain-containing protein [Myxococcales bacterium]|nr:PilZ domain-containing protein [Myxococcales bacterium]
MHTPTPTPLQRAPRREYHGMAVVHVEPDELTCLAGNISETGMLLFARRRRAPDSARRVRVSFALPNQARWVVVDATIVREARVRSRLAMGLRFESIPANVARLIREYVRGGELEEHDTPPSPTPPEVELLAPDARPRARPAFDYDTTAVGFEADQTPLTGTHVLDDEDTWPDANRR